MAKSKLEKLREAIEDGNAFLSGAIIGEEIGQYHKLDYHEFVSVLETAELTANDEGLEPSSYESEIVVISETKKHFEDSVVIEISEETVEITSKVVFLKGTASQCIGSHTLHYKSGVINFREGKVELPIELADELIEAGYAAAE